MAFRRFSSSTGQLFAGKFFNRGRELQALHAVLRPATIGDAGQIVLLTGPKDSGKSAMLQEFWARQRGGTYEGVCAFVDLRERNNMKPEQLAQNLAHSFSTSLELKGKLNGGLVGDWEFSVSADRVSVKTPLASGSVEYEKKTDSMDMIMEALEGYMSSLSKHARGFRRGFPTVFIDEANALSSWATTAEGRHNLETLLRFLVRISKQSNAANVVLASSENLFKQWLMGQASLRGHRVVPATIGHLTKEEAKEFVCWVILEGDAGGGDVGDRAAILEAALRLWEDVYEHYGGRMSLLRGFTKLALTVGEKHLGEAWESAKRLHMEMAMDVVASGFQPDTLSSGVLTSESPNPPAWTEEQWRSVVEALGKTDDGWVSFYTMARAVSGTALASMLEYDFLHYRPYTGWDRDVNNVTEWPIITAASKAQHLVMKKLAQAA